MRRNPQRPPILAILALVLFLLVVLYFVAGRQLRNSKAHRLRLLAGFSERIENTVPDLAERFVRIARQTEKMGKVREYVNQIPYLTFLDEGPSLVPGVNGEERPKAAVDPNQTPGTKKSPPISKSCIELGTGDPPAVCIESVGRSLYLLYRGPGPKGATGSGPSSEEGPWRTVRARLDLEALLGPAVLPETFDSILAAEAESRRVLFQQGEPELRLTSLAPILEAAGDEPGANGEKKGALFALLSIFPLGVLAWPFLKLHLISPRQRLTRVDVAFLVLSTFSGCFLLALLVLDLPFYGSVRAQVDDQLEALGGELESGLFHELSDAYEQLESLQEQREQIQALDEGAADRMTRRGSS